MKIYQQPDVKETKQFGSKIWEQREHNKKSEWINIEKELQRPEESRKVKIHLYSRRATLKKETKLYHFYSRQTDSQREEMLTAYPAVGQDPPSQKEMFCVLHWSSGEASVLEIWECSENSLYIFTNPSARTG